MLRWPILTNAVLVALSCMVAIVLLEGALRARTYVLEGYGVSLETRLQQSSEASPEVHAGGNLKGIVRASPFADIVYELRPNLRGTFRGKPFVFSSIGIRDQEYAVTKPPGTFRLVGIGDSVMFGWGVDADDSYLSRIERTLNENASDATRFEVLNFAVPGYNTTMEVATLERKALVYQPDMVVLHFVGNDLGLPLLMQSQQDVLDLSKSFLVEFLAERFSGAQSDSPSRPDPHSGNLERNAQLVVPEKYRPMVGSAGFVRAMEKLAQLTATPKIPVVILTGSLPKSLAKLVSTQAQRHGFRVMPVQPFVDRLVQREGIADTKEARAAALQFSPADAHPNALGHQAFADALLDYLETQPSTRPLIAKPRVPSP